MMIGTCERVRSSRHTSTPEIRGSITSSSTSAGRTASKRAIASAPSAATSTRKPSRSSATRRASRYDCSSSTTRINGASGISGDLLVRSTAPRARSAFERQHEAGTSIPALRRDSTVTSPPCACATWRTIDEPEPGAAGRRDSGPGRPGRSARRCARGRGSGCRSPASPRLTPPPRSPCSAVLTVTGLPGSEYFTALSRRLAIALTTWRRSHATSAPVTPGLHLRG